MGDFVVEKIKYTASVPASKEALGAGAGAADAAGRFRYFRFCAQAV